MMRGQVAQDAKGDLWKIEDAPKGGYVLVSSIINPLSMYRAPVAELTILPGVSRRSSS